MTDKVVIKADVVTPLKETFEQKSKKKTSFSSSPSDENYPSEKLVKTSLDNKVDKVNGKGLSTEDYTTAEKSKLSGIEAQANKTIVDSALSSSSQNPVQNKVINSALSNKADSSSLSNYVLTSKILDDITEATDNTQVVGALELKQALADVEAGVPSGVELLENKVSTWTGTNANTTYPSEKLVKTSLDSKLDDSQLVTSISNVSDDNHMPSAKAVYDFVNSVPKWTTQVASTIQDLPASGSVGVFYLVPNSGGQDKNAYDEYFWNGTSYEKFGTKTLDISNLVTLDDVLDYINNNGSLSLPTNGADAGYLVFKIT